MNIHENARVKIDKLTEELFLMMQEMKMDKLEKQEDNIELYDIPTITSNQIKGDLIINGNKGGQVINQFFGYKEKMIGFTSNGINKMDEIVKEIYKNKEIRELVSINFLKKQIFAWCKDKYKEEVEEEKFSQYIINKIKSEISDYIVYIPIPCTYTYIGEFTLGHIKFTVFTEDMIENILKVRKEFNVETRKNIEKMKIEVKKEHQGTMCALYQGRGEEEKIREIAYEHLSNALGFLRILSSPNVNPNQVSISYEYGYDSVQKYKYFIAKGNEVALCTGVHKEIDVFNINKLVKDGLKSKIGINYDKLLKEENLNEYQQLLINSVNIYSKNTLKYDISDKLLYILSALESMLLKNDTEPIVQNISERMAFLIGKSLEQRKMIIKNVKEIYGIRSKFVHHGMQFINEYNTIKEFMDNVFMVFIILISEAYNYSTKEELIRDLEDRKLR